MRKKSILGDKKGAALATVLVVFLTLVIVVFSATAVAQSNFFRAKDTSDRASAYYIAELGLEEMYDQISEYIEDGKFVVDAFLESIGAEEGVKLFEYGKIMNEEAKALVNLESIKDDQYKIVSRGSIGKQSRVLEMEFNLNIEDEGSNNDGKIYQPDANLAIGQNLSNPGQISSFGTGNLNGPIVTNKEISVSNFLSVNGPIVTNNIIEVTGRLRLNSDNNKGIIITSSNLVFQTNQSSDIFAIVLKPGGKINVDTYNTNEKINIKTLLIPIGVNESDVILGMRNSLQIDNIVYYTPQNFDPYLTKELDGVNLHDIFGSEPRDDSLQVDYREYFRENFILDNLGTGAKVMPTVKLPEKPNPTEFYPFGNALKEEERINVGNNTYHTIVDINNNLLIKDNYWNNRVQFPVLGTKQDSVSSRYYRSIIINGKPSFNEATKIFIGDKDIVLVTDSLEMTGHLELIGTGRLRIYVLGNNDLVKNQNLNIEIPSFNTRDSANGSYTYDFSKLQVVVYEAVDNHFVDIVDEGGHETYISIFSENLNLRGGGTFKGSFISKHGKTVSLSGRGKLNPPLIFAPDATLNLSEGATLTGVVTVNDFNISGGSTISFENEMDKSFVEEILPDFIYLEDVGDGGNGGSSEGGGISIDLDRGPIREVK